METTDKKRCKHMQAVPTQWRDGHRGMQKTYQNEVKERGLVHTDKLTVPTADLVFRLRSLRQLEVVLHVLNHLGQDAGVHVLKRDLVLPFPNVYGREAGQHAQEMNDIPASAHNDPHAHTSAQVRSRAHSDVGP